MTDLLLVFPPSVLAETFPVSLAALKAYVAREGYDVAQDDWNARFNAYCLDRTTLDVVAGDPTIGAEDRQFIKNYFLHYVAGAYFADHATESWLTAPHRREGDGSIWAPPFPFSYMQFLEDLRDDPDGIEPFLEDADRNIFHGFFEEVVLPRLGDPRIVGFSMVSYAQAIPAMTLARLLRRHRPDVHICWGGPWVTSFCHIFAPSLAKATRLNALIDSFVVKEGEGPLLEIVRAVCAGRPPIGVQNTWLPAPDYRSWMPPTGEWVADMRELPTPDYLGFEPALYTSYQEGHGSVVVQGSRSCYHMKCTFCNAITNLAPKYRERPVEMIKDDIARAFADVPSATVVDFADAVFPARRLRSIAEFFLDMGRSELTWEIDVRFERNISKELIELIQRSGGLLRFGLETASERLLRLVEKGNRIDVVRRILSDSRDLGYKPFLMTIVGLPSETVEDVHALVDFLTEWSDTSTFQIADFMVEYGSPIHRAPRDFGIDIRREDIDKLSHHIPFERMSGYDNALARHAFPAALSEVLRRIHGAGQAAVEASDAARTVQLRFDCGALAIPPVRFRYNGLPFGGVVAIGYRLQQAVTPMTGAGVLVEEGASGDDFGHARSELGFDEDLAALAGRQAVAARAAPTLRCAAG